MSNPDYLRLRQIALKTAEKLGRPSFYIEHRGEIQIAQKLLRTNRLLKRCRSYLNEELMGAGHGLAHSEAVAIDAGTIIQIESRFYSLNSDLVKDIIICVEIAGLLHDIRRKERDHTIHGSNEAKKILENFLIESRYKQYIINAIRNHEAFKEILEYENEIAKLISDSLYDADKFRWGPDNFTTTIWLILESSNTPIEILSRNFDENMRYIERIKETFRTKTGKKYGPEFIDKGIKIGKAIYEEMGKILGDRSISSSPTDKYSDISFPHLFQEGKIGTCLLRNRLIMSLYPTKYSTDSRVNERMIEFYRERARGGVAMIVLDCPCLDFPRAYKGPNELRFDTPEFAQGIVSLLNAIHSEGVKAFMQLNYPAERVIPEEVRGARKKGKDWVLSLVNSMTSEDTEEIIHLMTKGAKRARELGYDGIEIQAGYGELISQLLSPLTNKRTDDYGGVIENRSRFLTNLIKSVKNEAGNDYPVMVKLVCDEFALGGLTIEDAKVIAKLISESGGDAILATGGNKETKNRTIPSHYLPPGSLVHLSESLKKEVDIPVIAVGKINTPMLAESIIKNKKADFVAMTRALIADPYLPEKAKKGAVADIRGCIYCLEDCADKGAEGIGRACTVNPFSGQEYHWKVKPALKKKKVIVIGGGPSGMQAAILARQRGHDVTLYERNDSLGGQLRLAFTAPFKEEVKEALRYLEHTLRKMNPNILLGKDAKPEDILSQEPYTVIIATGSRTALPPIKGIENSNVFDVRAVYEALLSRRQKELGKNIVIIGGGEIGCETADLLSSPSCKITIVEILDDILNRMKEIPRRELLRRLKEKDINILTGYKATNIEKGRIIIEDKGGNKREIMADSVIVSVGSIPENSLYDSLKGKVPEIYLVGDAKKPCDLGAALRSGCEIGLEI